MPDAAAFLSGFGLIQGTEFDNYILNSAISTHETVKRYKEYFYQITLTFTNLGSGIYNDLFLAVSNKISQQPIVYGIRNPYRCFIDSPKYGDITEDNNGTVTFNLTGHSYRV